MTIQDMQNQIDSLQEEVGYWNGLANEFEHNWAAKANELEEVTMAKEAAESDLWDREYKLKALWEALEGAETLEEFQEIVEDQYNLYGKPLY